MKTRFWTAASGVITHIKLASGDLAGAAAESIAHAPGLHSCDSEQSFVLDMPGTDKELAPGLTEAMVRFAVRHEYARNVEDTLARRSRQLFLDARLAAMTATAVGAIVADETGADPQVAAFKALAADYLRVPA